MPGKAYECEGEGSTDRVDEEMADDTVLVELT